MLVQWGMIEAHLRRHYGATARDILNGWTWREFRVIIDTDFTFSDEDGDAGEGGDEDWESILDRAIGRVPPSRKVQVSSIEEFAARYGG